MSEEQDLGAMIDGAVDAAASKMEFEPEGELKPETPAEPVKGAPAQATSQPAADASPPAPSDAGAPPQSWTKEAQEKWATLDPVLQKEIAKREQDAMQGISQYKGQAEQWGKFEEAMAPFAATLKQANIDPLVLSRNLAGAHFALTFGTPEQKVQMVARLIGEYQMDKAAIVQALIQSPAAAATPSAEVTELRQKIAQLEGQTAQVTTFQQQQMLDRISNEVTNFASAKDAEGTLLHPHFETVSADITSRLQRDANLSLEKAYEEACWTNPEVRKVLTQPVPPPPPPSRANSVNLKVDDKPVRATSYAGLDIDATVEKAARELYARH